MNRQTLFIIVAVALGSVILTSVGFWLLRPATANAVTAANIAQERSEDLATSEPIQPIRKPVNLDARKVSLGRKLFNDVRLSSDNTISCRSCHDPRTGGVDGKVHSLGINGAEGDVNAPTVFNSSLNFKQFWDGRVDSLEDQIESPTHNVKEMGSTWPQIIQKLSEDAEYVRNFGDLYGDGIQGRNIKDAIATFERSLVTVDSRFDKFLRRDASALTDSEKKGYQYFKDLGCISCHQGMNAGGNMFQPFGLMEDYFADRGNVSKADLGRFNVTGQLSDRYKFRVPGLRNVELTAPYFHDGTAKTLEDAVRMMGRYQLGQPISEDQVALIVEFLKTLTGNTDGLGE